MKNKERHVPLTRQRSPWVGRPELTQTLAPGVVAHYYMRKAADGGLLAITSQEPCGWHLSISFRDHKNELTRYPTWDEQVHAVRELLPPDLTYVMVLPPDGPEYVSLHDTTMHWHELNEKTHTEQCCGGEA